jgi:beta-lactamase superfamily II metal-dependent hydrolase
MIHIRLFNVGFGDCILITVEQAPRPWRMLIDCGVHPAGPSDISLDLIVNAVIDEITDDGVAHLDLVVATHRHRDHISGFANPRWSGVEVSEVWLPWTEDPASAEAQQLQASQETAARALQSLALESEQPGLTDIALNSLTNVDAMATLQQGFAATPRRRYLPSPDDPVPLAIRPPGLSSGLIHILGPSHDLEVLRHMQPPQKESYRSLTAQTNGAAKAPFPDELAISQAEYDTRFPELGELLTAARRGRLINTGKQTPDDALGVVAGLDNAINNTSLVMVLEVAGHAVLLPGDAQWGPWQSILANPQCSDLIKRTSLYKVSHHGSHNGTPKSIVAALPETGLTAAVSVHRVPQWTKIPEKALLAALSERAAIVRTDSPTTDPTGVKRAEDDSWVELSLS